MHYSQISHLQRGVKPQYLRSVCVLCREENSHDRKAVISMTTSPSITLLLNLHQVPISLSSTVPEVFIAIMQYPEVLPLLKLKVLPNFSCPINWIVRLCRGKLGASLWTLEFRIFRILAAYAILSFKQGLRHWHSLHLSARNCLNPVSFNREHWNVVFYSQFSIYVTIVSILCGGNGKKKFLLTIHICSWNIDWQKCRNAVHQGSVR